MKDMHADVHHVNKYELDSAAAEVELVIQRMAERENDEREKLSKRYTTADEREARDYDRGYSDGYRAGCQDCWGQGFDAGLKQAAQEQKDKEEEEKSD